MAGYPGGAGRWPALLLMFTVAEAAFTVAEWRVRLVQA